MLPFLLNTKDGHSRGKYSLMNFVQITRGIILATIPEGTKIETRVYNGKIKGLKLTI
jgi:hypothetical protein